MRRRRLARPCSTASRRRAPISTQWAAAGVDLDDITDQLERAGVRQFSVAPQKMIDAIARKRERVGV